MIKAAFFDIDSTLFDHRHKRWDYASIEAIKEIQKKGIKVFLATARPYASIKSFGTLDLGINWDGYVACSGGYAVLGDKPVLKTIVKMEDVKRFKALCDKYHQTMEVIGETERRLYRKPTKSALEYYKVYRDYPQRIDPDVSFDAISILLFTTKKYDARFKKAFPHLTFFRFFDYACDVFEVEHKKSDGIAAILENLGYKKEEAIAFGDDLQDIPMKDAVGTFIAMKNGKDAVKDVASFVTEEVWNEGVKKGLEKVGLL